MIGPKVSGKPRFARGPLPFPVFQAVAAGQVVSAGSGGNLGKVGVAVLNAIPLGVATTPGLPAGTSTSGTSPSGYPSFEASPMPESTIAIARKGVFYLAAAGTFAFGDFVKCAAAGGVVKWDPAADQANPQLGQCVDVAGGTNGSPSLIDLNIQG